MDTGGCLSEKAFAQMGSICVMLLCILPLVGHLCVVKALYIHFWKDQSCTARCFHGDLCYGGLPAIPLGTGHTDPSCFNAETPPWSSEP